MQTRRLVFFIAVPLLCLAMALPAPAQEPEYSEYSHARIVRLSLVDGDVQVRRTETGEWEAALLNLPIQQGYTLSSGRGRAEVELESGATIRIAENTTLEFSELALADGARITRLALVQGTATFYANLSREDVFRVATPYLDVEIPDDARFRLDASESGSYVTVLKGNVRVGAAGEFYKVTKGRTLAFYAGGSNEVKIARSAESDEFDRWVADRDEVLTTARNDALRYVNSPFRYGLADLTNYGAWYRDAAYGWIWVPLGTSAGWSPFFHGRWLHVGGFGWTWISYEPWGWLPYHYGSWIYTGSGWAWVPRGFHQGWHPGRVTWYQFGNQIGWCPTNPQGSGGPQGGVVVINTPGGAMTGAQNRTTRMNPDERPQMLSHSPLRRDARIRQLDDPGTQEILRERRFAQQERQAPSGTTATVGGSATTSSETEARPAERTPARVPSGIVYDPETRRFVNNPRAPVRTYPADETRAPSATAGRPAPAAREVTPGLRNDAPETPARTTVQVPSRSVRGDRLDGPRPATTTARPDYAPSRPVSPPSRMETPRPAPTTRVEPVRPAPPPPPRMETPRPQPTPPQRPAEVRPPPPPKSGPERPSTKD